jgi:NADH-quinone oxidoreductase subunit F
VSFQLDKYFLDQIIREKGAQAEAVIPILQAIQAEYRYLPAEALEYVCSKTSVTNSSITGVSTFYSQFRHRPAGEHQICVCHGTACHVKGAPQITNRLRRHLKIADGDDTDSDGLFTIEKVACLGCCTLAPVLQIDGVTYGRLTAAGSPEVLERFLSRSESEVTDGVGESASVLTEKGLGEIRIGLGSCCVAGGSGDVHQAINNHLSKFHGPAQVKRVGCVGACHQTPLLELVEPGGKSHHYAKVSPEDIPDIVDHHFPSSSAWLRWRRRGSRFIDRLVGAMIGEPVVEQRLEIDKEPARSFFVDQCPMATEACGKLDPTDIDQYRSGGGFSVAERLFDDLTPEQILQEIADSGLRGRGGAGFSTARKWKMVAENPSPIKYIIANGDEGDPGAFMDRMLLESFPFRVLEGIAIAARAVGASEVIMYIRAEYPLAVRRVSDAIEKCREAGLLGLSSDPQNESALKIRVVEGAGAFVCGEETGLIASLEGRRGTPRLRPPYPAESGLHGRPTLVNNIETFALLPWILRGGGKQFAQIGTESSQGTKVFALAGKVVRGGLVEVPMGMTIRQVVEQIGGGVADGRRFKAVQIGGPSGGCVPAALIDTPIDYESLREVGAIMGSGGLVVLDETDCMVDVARYFLEFTQDQSCGRCTFCRVGTRRMLDILTRLCQGKGVADDLDELESLAIDIKKGSLCGLGQTAPNPILSTLRHFRDEYEAHIEGRCPAGKCVDLIRFQINQNCIGCTLCATNCPVGAIAGEPYRRHTIDPARCVRCGACKEGCPRGAVEVH